MDSSNALPSSFISPQIYAIFHLSRPLSFLSYPPSLHPFRQPIFLSSYERERFVFPPITTTTTTAVAATTITLRSPRFSRGDDKYRETFASILFPCAYRREVARAFIHSRRWESPIFSFSFFFCFPFPSAACGDFAGGFPHR